MIPTQLHDSQSLFVKPLDSPFHYKPDSSALDFLELVSTNNPSASTLSVNDEYGSVRADDEISKPLTEFDTLVFRLSKRNRKQKKIAKEQQDQTLVEIISKRIYTKPVKMNSTASDSSNDVIIKKRKLNTEADQEKTEMAIASDKETNNGDVAPIKSANNVFPQPQLVLKDGKVQLDVSQLAQGAKPQMALEIVKSVPKKVTTSSSFRKSSHTEKWTTQETKKFYRALEIFGTDFAMITKLFHKRNRNQIKNKFLREEKAAPEKVNAIFRKPKTVNFEKLIARFQKKSINCSSKANLLSQAQHEMAVRKRSGSFHSMTSLDSVDVAIMEDLAEVFKPSRKNSGLPSSIREASS